jgi:formylglycine-generating enzyme required for sulfatase activity
MTGGPFMTRIHLSLAVLFAAAVCLQADDKPGTEKPIAGIKLCWCPPGTFTMGSPESEPGHRADEAQVEVTLTKGFWTAKYGQPRGSGSG